MTESNKNVFDYGAFIDDGFVSQTKYAKAAGDEFTPEELKRIDTLAEIGGRELWDNFGDALEYRYRKMIEHFGHLTEESIEARVYVPRRSWKTNEPSYLDDEHKREEFIAEMFDVLLFHRAILAYAGVTGKEFWEVAQRKMAFNKVRPDHNVNGNESAIADPSAELHGDCPSAEFTNIE